MKNRFKAIATVLALALAASLAPVSAFADGNGDEIRPIRLYASASFGPVGKIAASSFLASDRTAAVVNGRAASGETPLWGGELIEAPRDKSLRISFDEIGEVLLSSGAMARFSTALLGSEDGGRNRLVTNLIAGHLSVQLKATACAYIEAAGTGYTASRGANFQVGINEAGLASIDTESGTVTASLTTTQQQRYILRPPQGQGGNLSVSARSTRQIQIQVTDENDRPIPDIPILFSLADPCLGSLGAGVGAGTLFKGKSDRRGIASIPWIAGAAKCAGNIIAKVEGTDTTYTFRVQVTQGGGFWSPRNSLIVGGIAAGATTGIVVAATRNNTEPIQAVPPPTVRP